MSNHDPLLGLRAVQAPEGLRERALSAARRAAAEPVLRASRIDSLWESRLLWGVWAGAVVALLATYVWVGRSLSPALEQGLACGDGVTIAALRAGDGVIGVLGPVWPRQRANITWTVLDREDWPSML